MGLFDKLKSKVKEAIEETKTSIRETVDNLRYDRLKEGLAKTREGLAEKIGVAARQGRKIDDALLDELEESLIMADVGADTTIQISDRLRDRVKAEGFKEASDLSRLLREEISALLKRSPSADNDRLFSIPEEKRPHVIMVVGVNGVGKTTTIGKLAYNYRNAGLKVLIGAADTFRAAANEQLEVWAERAGVEIIGQGQGADPAAVAFDTLQAAVSRGADVVIIDTAGRLHTKSNLMQELQKMSRVMKKIREHAPDEVFLVLDATTGQNAIQQAKEFTKAVEITGLVLTKLDGTAKGGVVIAIANELSMPVRYIGVGERIDDLQPFNVDEFAEALFAFEETEEVKEE
ncbi:MAG: signal recognition particle-docking protein FtsY [Chlorobi bacterium]|jgi:fused signal recognition particle receptor|nr:signal recognition particle-docking protein FtsY [Chlorobiota bacterium]